MLLSLIIPFFNSEYKSKRLLKTLAKIKQKDIEFILINDGSTDNTFCLLEEFKVSIPESNVTLINQDNKGPGGARNSGLKIAQGEYVWFVDSDDDITLEAVNVLRENRDRNYDFVDFNVQSSSKLINSMSIEAGEYTDKEQMSVMLLNNFGRIWSKAIRRVFLLDNNIFYPEYCLYEDNPLAFIYPFLVKRFLKTEVVGYVHNTDFESITRSAPNLRTLDRLYTSIYGLEEGLKLAKSSKDINTLKSKFLVLYLINTVAKFTSKTPSKNWVTSWKVMKQYRKVAKNLDIDLSPFEYMKPGNKFKLYFTFHWVLSFLILSDQTNYFDAIRKKAWK